MNGENNMFKKISFSMLFIAFLAVAFSMSSYAEEFTTGEFSINYPGDWKIEKGETADVLFLAKKPTGSPWELVIERAMPGANFIDVLKEVNKSSTKDFKAEDPSETVTADGTKAFMTEIEFLEPKSGYGAAGVALGAEKNGKWYIVMVNTVPLGFPYDYEAFLKIAKSFKFVK
jgi:hypothetical protein